jgi:hypothetical protein
MQLAYAAPTHARPLVILYRIAQFCWAVPLVVGVACLALYAITRFSAIPAIGFLAFLAGGALFGIGLICLVVFWCLLGRCANDVRQSWSNRSKRLLGLLLLNIPIAMGCAVAGLWLMSRLTVVVENQTGVPLDDVRISLPGNVANFGTVAAGAKIQQTFTLRGDGDVEFSAIQAGMPIQGAAGEYISNTHFNARQATVTFRPSGGSATVQR